MLRTIVTYLAVLPMLMPPGVCVCQLVPGGRAAAATAPPPPTGHAADGRRGCVCASCRERQPEAGTSTSDGPGDRPSDDGPRRPVPAEHWPGCPAADGAMPPTSVVPPSVTGHLALDLPGTALCPAADVVTAPVRPGPPALSAGSPPPLFISHCALLF